MVLSSVWGSCGGNGVHGSKLYVLESNLGCDAHAPGSHEAPDGFLDCLSHWT